MSLSFDLPALSLPAIRSESRKGKAFTQSYGSSFYDFKPYQRHDQLQHVYWDHYYKTGRLVVKQYEAYRQGHLCIILDASASMGTSKELWLKVCTCIQYISLSAFKGGHVVHYLITLDQDIYQLPSQLPTQQLQQYQHNMQHIHTLIHRGAASNWEIIFNKMRTFLPQTYFVYLSDFLQPADELTGLADDIPPYHLSCMCFTQMSKIRPQINHMLYDPEIHSSHESNYKELSNLQAQNTLIRKVEHYYTQLQKQIQQQLYMHYQEISLETQAMRAFQHFYQQCESNTDLR